MSKNKGGSKVWYIADGYMPTRQAIKDSDYEGHESIMILNCNDEDAEIFMDIYFEDKDPIENIRLIVSAKRVKCIRMDHPEEIGGVKIDRLKQYGLRFQSKIEVIIQYGKMDITQPNLAFIGTFAYSE